MKTFTVTAVSAAMILAAVSCSHKITDESSVEVVVWDEGSVQSLENAFESIEIIKLDDTPKAMIGDDGRLRCHDGDYYVANRDASGNVLRFDNAGRLVNSIGCMGRGPEEYTSLGPADFAGSEVRLYCRQEGKVMRYTCEGEVKGSVAVTQYADNAIVDDNGVWIYYGYGMTSVTGPYRLVKVGFDGDTLSRQLYQPGRMMPISVNALNFVSDGNNEFLFENFNPEVYRLSDTSLTAVMRFDFGRYNVDKAMFDQRDPMDAGTMFMNSKWVLITDLSVSDDFVAVTAYLPDGKMVVRGIKNRTTGEWKWYNTISKFAEPTDDVFARIAFSQLDNKGNMLFMVSAMSLLDSSIVGSELISNAEVLADMSEDDNSVILKCRLKR